MGADVTEEISRPSSSAEFAACRSSGNAGFGDVGCQETGEPQADPPVEKNVEAPPTYRDDLYTLSFFAPINGTHIVAAEEEQLQT